MHEYTQECSQKKMSTAMLANKRLFSNLYINLKSKLDFISFTHQRITSMYPLAHCNKQGGLLTAHPLHTFRP